MADRIVRDESLTAVANEIRTKAGVSGSLNFPNGFVSALDSIPVISADMFQVKTGLIAVNSETTTLNITGLGFTPVGFMLAVRAYASTSRGSLISTFSYPGRDTGNDVFYGLYSGSTSANNGLIGASVSFSSGALSATITKSSVRWKDTYFYVVWGN